MQARVNPDRLAADSSFRVLHPDTRRPFPGPDPFDLSAADQTNPRVRRLFARDGLPGGLPGGVFGDLLAVPDGVASAAAIATISTARES